MKKNRPECWGMKINRFHPKVIDAIKRGIKVYKTELPECPCSFIKSCTRRENKITRIIMGAINNPRSK
ncbi:hypothetical protein ES702_01452 [subsurface metagenome]